MVTAAVTAFLIAHGLIHLGIYIAPIKPDERVPYDPSSSWALRALHVGTAPMHAAAASLALMVAATYTAAGLAVPFSLPAAGGLALVAAGVALVLKAVWYNPWLKLGVLLDFIVIYAVAYSWPPSLH